MTDLDILAEGRRRLRLSNPNVSDEQFAAWQARATQAGASFELTLDGVVATYRRANAPAGSVARANHHSNPTQQQE